MNIRNKNASFKKVKKNPWLRSRFNVILILACVTFGIAYVIGINNLTVQGFTLQDSKAKSDSLVEQNQDLQAKVLNLQSYASLSPRLNDLEMVAVEEIIYLATQVPVVAKN